MDPLTVSPLELSYLKMQRELEAKARDVLSNILRAQLKVLFPTAPDTFLDQNGHFANELARGAGEIADAISAASINWTGPNRDEGVEKLFTKELVRLMAVDGLVSGKLALFPRIDESGAFVVEALTGYLHPILGSGNALRVEALLQVLPVTVKDQTLFEVRVYRPGILEVYPAVQDLTEALKGQATPYPQGHSPDTLPVAFKVVRRDAHRRPQGLVMECLEAFLRYAKTAINTNAAQEVAAFPERVVKSDEYLRLVTQGDPLKPGQEHPAVTALKKVGARLLKVIGTNDSYEVNEGIDLAPHMASESSHKQALLDLLRSPDLSGGNLSGVALAERQNKSRQLISDMCNYIADLVTECCAIADGLPQANIGEGIAASLTPRWAIDRAAIISEATEAFSKGGIPKSVYWQRLQTAGWTEITDEMLERQRAVEVEDSGQLIST